MEKENWLDKIESVLNIRKRKTLKQQCLRVF